MKLVLIVVMLISCQQTPTSQPVSWKELLGKDAKEYWIRFTTNNKLDFKKVYKLGGKGYSADGDREFKDAIMIYSTSNDPFDFIKAKLEAKDVNLKVYSILLISHLKDKRFYQHLTGLEKNSTPINNFFYGKTIGEIAKYAKTRIADVDDLRSESYQKYASKWIKKSWSLKIQSNKSP